MSTPNMQQSSIQRGGWRKLVTVDPAAGVSFILDK